MRVTLILFVLCSLLGLLHALYTTLDDVTILTSQNFHSKVIDSKKIWYVKFYSPGCGHCIAFAPEFKKAATAVKGFANFGVLDISEYNSLAQQYKIHGVPSIKIFAGETRAQPREYTGPRDSKALAYSVIDTIKSIVQTKLGISSSTGGSSDVIELTDDDFDSMMQTHNDSLWLVEFYAPWCGHCKNLAPEWARAASELKGKAKLAAVDATKWSNLATRFKINGFPTIKVFYPNGKVEDYNEGRTKAAICDFVYGKLKDLLPPPEVKELINQDAFNKACSKQICVIAFLPHILDCQSECRNEKLGLLKNLSTAYKERDWGWLWVEGMTQPEIEAAVGVGGFGYPALVALNVRKKLNQIFRGSFDFVGLNEFFRDLSYGKGFPASLRAELPVATEIEPWDGKDGEYPVDESGDDLLDEEEIEEHSDQKSSSDSKIEL